MKLKDAISAIDTYSGKTSDIVRQMSLAGIALIWVFKSGTADHPQLDIKLMRAALFIVASLTLDLFQYLSSYVIWNKYVDGQEASGKEPEDEVIVTKRIFLLNDGIFYCKAVAMLIAYIGFLLPYLVWKFSLHA